MSWGYLAPGGTILYVRVTYLGVKTENVLSKTSVYRPRVEAVKPPSFFIDLELLVTMLLWGSVTTKLISRSEVKWYSTRDPADKSNGTK